MAYYREQFNQAKEEGRSEEDTVLMLGRPKANAEKELAIYSDQIKADKIESDPKSKTTDDYRTNQQSNVKNDSNQSPQQPVNYLMLILLIVFNVVIVLGPAMGLFFTGLGLWISSIILMATPLICFWVDGMLSFPAFYPILAAVGAGILLFVAMYYLFQLADRLIRAYFKAMNRLVRGN